MPQTKRARRPILLGKVETVPTEDPCPTPLTRSVLERHSNRPISPTDTVSITPKCHRKSGMTVGYSWGRRVRCSSVCEMRSWSRQAAARQGVAVTALIPGYEPCRECRYWLGVVTESCAAHRPLPSAAELRGLHLMRARTEGRHPWSWSNEEIEDVEAARAWLDRKVSP
jgi:hypothetical protein